MAFRSASLTAPANGGTTTTVTAPAGIQDGDILIGMVYAENDATITPPTGFGSNLIVNIDHSGVGLDLWVWWKRASGESGNYVFTASPSTYFQAGMICLSGRVAAGDPQDAVATSNQGSGTTVTYTGLTPAGDDADIICVNGTFDSVASGNASGSDPAFTERGDDSNNLHFYTGTKTSAGAVSNSTSTIGSTSWVGTMIAIRSATPGGGGATVTPGVASLTTSGKAPTVTASDHKSVTPGVRALVTSLFAAAVSVSNNQSVTPGQLAMALSLFAATVTATQNQLVTPGQLALSTSPFAPTVTRTQHQTVTPDVLALALSLFAATVTASGNQSVTPGTLALVTSPRAPDVNAGGNVSVSPGVLSLALSAFAAVVTATAHQTVTPGALALATTPFAPNILTPVTVSPGVVNLALSPFAPSVQTPVVVTPGPAGLVTATFEPNVTATAHMLVSPPALALTIALFSPGVLGDMVATAPILFTTFAKSDAVVLSRGGGTSLLTRASSASVITSRAEGGNP